MDIVELFDVGLPLNRKERFYTGTVFPAIVCAERFAYFERLLTLLDIEPLETSWDPSDCNVQFFTEYSLRESVFTEADKARFTGLPPGKYAPDIVVLVSGPRPRLIALEAKVYDTPALEELALQMAIQSGLLEYIRSALGLPDDSVTHAALVPRPLSESFGPTEFHLVTWEQLYSTFLEGRGEDYFLALLRIALERWAELHSVTWKAGTTPDAIVQGAEIVARYEAGDLKPWLVGRALGLDGKNFASDLDSGEWAGRPYPVLESLTPPNGNWFAVADFVERVKHAVSGPDERP